MQLIADVLKSLSRGTSEDISKEFELIGNCFGFVGLKQGAGTSTLILELASAASSRGLHTCIVECNPLSNFYLAKSHKYLDSSKGIPSINKRFIKHSCDIVDCLITVNDYLKILSFGDTQISETFNMDYKVLENTYQELKEIFDLVLMDIPNYPWIEPMLAAINCCSTVYSVIGFGTEGIYTHIKLKNSLTHAGLDTKLNNLIIMGVPSGNSLKSSIEKALQDTRVLFEVPEIPKMKRLSLEFFSVASELAGKEAKQYEDCLNFLFTEITEGIQNKSINGQQSTEEDTITISIDKPRKGFGFSKKKRGEK